MRIISLLIIALSSVSSGFIISEVSATCDVNSQESASTYLKGCAGTNPANSISPGNGTDVSQIKKIIIDISKNVISFGALFAIGAIVFSGIQYTTSYGDDEKVKKAKMTGIYAVIGLFLLLLAFPLVDILINFIYSLARN